MHLKFLWLLQIVPQGRKWTSAFRTCGGGYLKSNHIALTGLSRSSLTEQVHLGPYFAHHAVPCKLIEIMSCCLSMPPCRKPVPQEQFLRADRAPPLLAQHTGASWPVLRPCAPPCRAMQAHSDHVMLPLNASMPRKPMPQEQALRADRAYALLAQRTAASWPLLCPCAPPCRTMQAH